MGNQAKQSYLFEAAGGLGPNMHAVARQARVGLPCLMPTDTTTRCCFIVAAGLAAALGCSGASQSGGPNGAGGAGASAGAGATGGSINIGGNAGASGGGGKLTAPPPCDQNSPDLDGDGDGFRPSDSDCNDCTAQMNPGALDYPGNGVDEDCNGVADDEPVGCDGTAANVAETDPVAAARALGICRTAQGKSWGLVSARWVKADGTPGMNELSHGILPSFGSIVTPRGGANLLALSSGTARQPIDPGYQSPVGAEMNTASYTPPGFPVDSPSCEIETKDDDTARDPAALELVIRVPTNSNQVSFDFNFYTFEFPLFVCKQYNDFFVALVTPEPANAQKGNVSFDSQGNPVSVNNAFLEACSAQTAGGKTFNCPLGTGQLAGTGFEEHAATGWLNTKAPVPAGYEITIRYAIWDMGDAVLDSTILIDNLTFDLGEGPPVTQPVPH